MKISGGVVHASYEFRFNATLNALFVANGKAKI